MSGPQYPGPDPNYPGGSPAPGPDLGKGGPAGPPPGAYPPPGQGSFPPPPPPVDAGQYGQPGQYGQAGAIGGVGAPAGAGVRLVARIIDGLIVGIPVSIVNQILWIAAPWPLALVVSLILAFASFAYFVYFETKQNGVTLGKKFLNLQVLGAHGGVPTTDESARRNAWMLLGVLVAIPVFIFPLVLGLVYLGLVIAIGVTISNDPGKKGWHDKFAGTSVIKTA